MRRTGAAFHSLRAVPLDSAARGGARRCGASMPALPLHIHVAEQLQGGRGLQRSTRAGGPIELLLDTGLVDRHWCLVHATHATAAELAGHRRDRRRRLRLDQHRGESGRRLLRCRPILEVGRTAVRRLRQPGHRVPRRGAALDGVPAAAAQAAPRRARRRSASRTSARACGAMRQSTARCAIGQPAGASRSGARADWLVLDARAPEHGGRDRGERRSITGVRGRQRGDPRCHGRRALGRRRIGGTAAEEPLARPLSELDGRTRGAGLAIGSRV